MSSAAVWSDDAPLGRFRDLAGARHPEAMAAALMTDAEWAAALLAPLLGDPAAAWPVAARRVDRRASVLLDRHATAGLGLGLIGMGCGGDHVVADGRLSLVRILAGHGTAEQWRAGPVRADFVADDAPALGACRREAFGAGEVLALDGRRDAWRIVPAGGVAALLTLTLDHDVAPVMRQYALSDGRMVRSAATEGRNARAAMLTAMLDALPAATARAGYAAASEEPAFFVRWQAMRGWLASDVPGARSRLAAMAADDPHPEVRSAARAVQSRLSACPA